MPGKRGASPVVVSLSDADINDLAPKLHALFQDHKLKVGEAFVRDTLRRLGATPSRPAPRLGPQFAPGPIGIFSVANETVSAFFDSCLHAFLKLQEDEADVSTLAQFLGLILAEGSAERRTRSLALGALTIALENKHRDFEVSPDPRAKDVAAALRVLSENYARQRGNADDRPGENADAIDASISVFQSEIVSRYTPPPDKVPQGEFIKPDETERERQAKTTASKSALELFETDAPPQNLWKPPARGHSSHGSHEKLFDFIEKVYGPLIAAGHRNKLRAYIGRHDKPLYQAILNFERSGKKLPPKIRMPSSRTLVRERFQKAIKDGLDSLPGPERHSVTKKLRRDELKK